MTDNDVKVTYKAVADFSALYREALKAKAALRSMNQEQAQGDKASVASAAALAAARKKAAAAANQEATAVSAVARAKHTEVAASNALHTAVTGEARARSASNTAAREAATTSAALTRAKKTETRAVDESVNVVKKVATVHNVASAALKRHAGASGEAGAATRRLGADMDSVGNRAQAVVAKIDGVVRSVMRIKDDEGVISGALSRIGSGFSKLNITIPTALVAGVAGLISAVNPLVAGISALGAAAIGTASSLGTLASAAIGIVPAMSAALGVVSALKVAMHGVGGAITAGIAAADAVGAGSSGGSSSTAAQKQSPYQLTNTEKITRAQQAYARSIQDVKFSEQNLFDARKQYTRQVQDLTEAVEQYTDATKAADAASVESAQQNYDNVLASSASTKADKDSARAAIEQAKEQQENDARQNTRNVQDLAELKNGGINNNQSVVQAGRGVVDAKNAERDAQLSLQNTKYNAAHPLKNPTAAANTTAAQKATNSFADAMGKLAPAAQEFVKWFLKFRDAWLVVQKAVQQAFFEKFVGDLNRVYKILPSIKSMLVDIAGALGKVVDKLLIQVTGSAWAKDFVTFGQEMKPLIADVGTIASGALDIFRNLTMAAMPFLQDVVHWLALGTTGFSNFIDQGRKTGTIQSYLDYVFVTLKKWWTIIKQVGDTLINYGIASSGFGSWLTDGLVKTTKAWDDASKKATDKNSPFKKYLESIKPVLTNIKGMFGDFFRWWAKTSADPDNVKTFNDVITIIRTQLGPALGDILKTLAKSGLIKDLAQAITDIVKAIDALLKNGGIKGLKDLYGIIGHLAKAVLDFTNTGFGKWLMNTVVPPLVILAGLSFAFGPLFALFAWIARLAGMKGVLGLLMGLGKGIKGADSAGRAVKGAEEGATVAKDATQAAKAAKAAPLAMRAGEGIGGIVRFLGSGIGAAIMGIATHGKMTTTGAIAGGEAAGEALSAAEKGAKGGGILGSALRWLLPKGAKPSGPKPSLGEELAGAVDVRAGGEGDVGFTKRYGKGIAHLKDFKSVEGLAGKLFLGFSVLDAFKQGQEALGGENGDGKPSEYYSKALDTMGEAVKEKDPKKRGALYNKAMGGVVGSAFQSIAGGAVQGAVNGSTIAAETLGPEAVPVGAIGGGIYGMVTSAARDLGGTKGIGLLGKSLDPKYGTKDVSLGRDMAKAGGIAGFFGSQAAGVGDITSSLKKGGGGIGVGLLNALGDITGIGGTNKASGDSMAASVTGGKGGKGGKDVFGTAAGLITKAWDGMLKPWKPVAKNIGDWWQKHVVKPFQDISKNIGDWWKNHVIKPFQDMSKKIGDWWNHNVVMPFKAFIGFLGRAWNIFVVTPFKKLIAFIGLLWNTFVVKPFQAVVKIIGDAWDKYIVQPFKKVIKVIQDAWDKYIVQPFKKAIKVIGDAWDTYVVQPFKKAIKAIQDAWNTYIVTPFKKAIKAIQDAWDRYIVTPFKAAIKAIHDAWDRYVVTPFKAAIKAIHDAWDRYVVTPFKAAIKAIQDAWNKYVVDTFKTVGNAIKTAWNNDVIRPLKGVAKTLTDAWNKWVIGPINKVTSGIGTFIHNVTHMDLAKMMTNFFNGLLQPSGGGATGKWAGTINQALQMAGAPSSWGKDISTIIQKESGGNPYAINLTDSNAQAGHPSQGLMQTIPGTFNSYAGSLRGRGINDPLANIYAGIKYIMSRYGSPDKTPGIRSMNNGGGYQGYSVGGVVHGQGSGDTVPAMLTPGEFVLTKKMVQKLGLNNLKALNNGVMDMSQLFTGLLQSQRSQAAHSMQNVMANYGQAAHLRPIAAPKAGTYNTFGDINIYNPAPEQASDSIPRTVRKLSYLKNGR